MFVCVDLYKCVSVCVCKLDDSLQELVLFYRDWTQVAFFGGRYLTDPHDFIYKGQIISCFMFEQYTSYFNQKVATAVSLWGAVIKCRTWWHFSGLSKQNKGAYKWLLRPYCVSCATLPQAQVSTSSPVQASHRLLSCSWVSGGNGRLTSWSIHLYPSHLFSLLSSLPSFNFY